MLLVGTFFISNIVNIGAMHVHQSQNWRTLLKAPATPSKTVAFKMSAGVSEQNTASEKYSFQTLVSCLTSFKYSASLQFLLSPPVDISPQINNKQWSYFTFTDHHIIHPQVITIMIFFLQDLSSCHGQSNCQHYQSNSEITITIVVSEIMLLFVTLPFFDLLRWFSAEPSMKTTHNVVT